MQSVQPRSLSPADTSKKGGELSGMHFLHNVDLFAVTNEQKRTAVMNDLY